LKDGVYPRKRAEQAKGKDGNENSPLLSFPYHRNILIDRPLLITRSCVIRVTKRERGGCRAWKSKSSQLGPCVHGSRF
jgi:hypothetical protein